jgi:hypothetical protein
MVVFVSWLHWDVGEANAAGAAMDCGFSSPCSTEGIIAEWLTCF